MKVNYVLFDYGFDDFLLSIFFCYLTKNSKKRFEPTNALSGINYDVKKENKINIFIAFTHAISILFILFGLIIAILFEIIFSHYFKLILSRS